MGRQWGNPTSGGAPAHLRRAALARDNHTCQKCGSPAARTHRRSPAISGGNTDARRFRDKAIRHRAEQVLRVGPRFGGFTSRPHIMHSIPTSLHH